MLLVYSFFFLKIGLTDVILAFRKKIIIYISINYISKVWIIHAGWKFYYYKDKLLFCGW